jgi:D-alanine-D-alanine ligase
MIGVAKNRILPLKAMRILVMHADEASQAPIEEEDTLLTARQIGEALGGRGHSVTLAPFDSDFEVFARTVRQAAPDVIFNMVEHHMGQDRLSAVAPCYYEKIGMPYTGGGAAAIVATGDKPFFKQILRMSGIPTPDWSEGPAWQGLERQRRYIVKASDEDASLGLDDGAVVSGDDVPARARTCFEKFGSRWFAEAYVEGREFNISVVEEKGGLLVLPLAEIRFENWNPAKPRIVGHNAKWRDDSEESKNTARCFGVEKEDPGLAAELARLSLETFKLFGNRGFARVDFRVDEAGQPLVLEVNPNPALDWDAGFAMAALQAGISYPDILEKIVAAALP